jgi:K+ transporter
VLRNIVPCDGGERAGHLPLIFWSLVIVISCKYLLFVMRADNPEKNTRHMALLLSGLTLPGKAQGPVLAGFVRASALRDGVITRPSPY